MVEYILRHGDEEGDGDEVIDEGLGGRWVASKDKLSLSFRMQYTIGFV